MDCQITYKGKDYTYDQFATLLHSGELEVLAPKMDSRYFIVNEGYNPFEGKQERNNEIELYHAGNIEGISENSLINELGIHLGSKETADRIGEVKDVQTKLYKVDIKNPIEVPDFARWEAFVVSRKLESMGILTESEFEKIRKETGNDKERLLLKILNKKGYDGFVYENAFEGGGKSYVAFSKKQVKPIGEYIKAQPLEQAKKNLSKAWNKLGNQGIVYDPIQNEKDFIDFVKALFDYVKTYGRDKAIPEMVNYVKGKLGIGEGGGLNKKTSDSVKDFATQILDKYNALTPKEINAVLTAYSEQVGKGAFEKNVDTLLKFGKLSIEKAQQFKELYQEVSDVKSRGEEERAKLNKDKIKFESPIQILARDMGDNPDGEVLTRLTAITTDRNQERSPEELQREATYVEETLPRLRNIAFEDASMIALYYNNASDWVDKFLTELESEKALGKKGERVYDVPSVRMVGILNVMNNVTYENIMKSTDPIEKENLLKLRKRLDAYTNDFMRGISLALGARRSDAVLAEFARGGVMSDYATSRILTKAQLQQIDALQKAITSIPTKTELNDVNIPSDNPIKKTKANPSTTKGKQKATTKKVDAKFESDMKEKAKGIKIEEREKKAKDLRDRLFNAINKCK